MKTRRKREKSLFFWSGDSNDLVDKVLKKVKTTDDVEECEIFIDNPQLELILKKAPPMKNSIHLPYEIYLKIFTHVIETSHHPLKDLCSLGRVSENWRNIILQSPELWKRIDLTHIPTTDRNFKTLKKVVDTIPNIMDHINELSLRGPFQGNSMKNFSFIENLLSAPNMRTVELSDINFPKMSIVGVLSRSIVKCKKLRSLVIVRSRPLFNNPKWLNEFLTSQGSDLEEVNLAMSLASVSSALLKSLSHQFCPRLRVLDLSTLDALNTHSFDAIQLSITMPNLEVLRLANISFRRVHSPPEKFGLLHLRELSIPIALRDADRDDALLATLGFGSSSVSSLDIRGSSISVDALLDMPSHDMSELHIDDVCPIQRSRYHLFIEKWSHSLEQVSLVKINCHETVSACLKALVCDKQRASKIRDLDLSSSDVGPPELLIFLTKAKQLNRINLSSCRSLPRGCKGVYSKNPTDSTTQPLGLLEKRLRAA